MQRIPQLKRLVVRAGAAVALALLVLPTVAASSPLFREVTDADLPRLGKGFGATWADLNHDGRLDMLLGRHGHGVAVCLDEPGLGFSRPDSCDFLPCVGIDQHGVAACDYDNDGDWDLYVTVGADRGEGTGPNQMWQSGDQGIYRNTLPDDHFMAEADGRGRGATWVCLDNDRYPELLVLNFMSPTGLYRFDGKKWHNRSKPVNPCLDPNPSPYSATYGRGLWFASAATADLDLDGHSDVVLDGDGHYIFRNDGRGALLNATAGAGLPAEQHRLLSTVLGDVDNDGDLDALHVFRWVDGVKLWLNESTPGTIRFVAGPSLSHLPLGEELDSAFLADLDNDGFLDLYVMMEDREKNNLPNVVARGVGDGTFTDVSADWGGLAGVAALPRGAWPLDFDRDGDLDLMVLGGKGNFAEREGLSTLYENTTTNGGLTLELATRKGAPHGLGARVALHTQTGVQVQQVRSVMNHWNSTVPPVHFGLGAEAGPYRIVVTWPGGKVQKERLVDGAGAYFLRQGKKPILLIDGH